MGDKPALPDLSAASFVKAQPPSLAAPLSQLRHSFSAPPSLPCLQVKFMCSHGGLVLPRPSDRKLRYVGGETRIFSVPRHICYAEFLGKMTEIYGQGLTLKYQLPEEDLDALVSVCSDDDLENMMEECARVDSCLGLSKLRVFIFSSSELDATDLSNVSDTTILEQRYVDAVNALMPEASFRSKNDLAFADFRMNSEGDNAFAWNATNMQENSFFLSEKPQLEAIVVSTGNALLSKTRLPEYVGAPTSPPHASSHSTFTRQPAVLETAPDVALDRFVSTSGFRGATSGVDTLLDLDCCSSASSSTSSHHELHHRATDSRRIPGSSMQALKEWTLDQKEEDHAYKVAQRCIADDVMHLTTSNEKLQRREHSDLQNNRCVLAFADDNERADNRLHTDLPWSTSNSQQKQLEPVWGQAQVPSGDKVVGVDPLRNPPRNVSFRQQQAFPMEQQQPPHNLLLCNPSATLDQKSALPGQIEDSSGVQSFFPAEAHPNLQQTSTSVYQTGGSAPSSPPREKFKATGKPGAFPLEGQIHQMAMTDQDLPTIFYDCNGSCKNNTSCCNSGHPSWSFLNPENTLSENLMDPHLGSKLVDVADLHFDGLPILAWSSTIPRQQMPSNFQNNEHATGAEAFSTKLQPPSLSFLEESVPTANLAAAVQSENEQFYTLGHIPLHLELALPVSAAVRGDTPTLGRAMVLESMQSSNCLPAEILVADMSISMPQGSPCQGGDEFTTRGKTEPAGEKIGVIEPSMSVQRDTQDKNFAFAQDSVSSREQFNKIRCQFDEDMDLDDAKSLERSRETMPTTSNPAHVLPSSLLNATWELSLSQSEHVHCVFIENSLKEQGLEGLAVENEVTYEDLTLEIEELDRFESLADPTSNAAVLAEQEAISRGLQTINNFDLEELRELGSGTFGTVYHGKWRGTDVAIKRIKSSCFTGRQSERERLIADFWREAYILGQLHHPNVVAFYGVVPDGPGGTLATVTEFMVNGSLKQVLQKKDRTLDHRKRLLIAMDAAFGMEYLHGKNVVHFDIKCENLLVNLRDTQRPICKVGDLGLSKVKKQTMVSGGVRGTLPWMAPELLNGTSSLVSEKVDVFSFGIVLWELLTGEEPYANMHYGAIIGGIVNNTLRPPIPKWCDPAWRILMEKCWSAEPAERPTFTDIAGSLRMMEASLNAKGQAHELTAGS